jgi:REP element-mobilizing transposase RayT
MNRVRFRGFDERGDVRVSRHHLPHWTQGGMTYFVTFRLGDSVPAGLLRQWQNERDAWLRWHPEPWTREVEAEYRERFTERQDEWLDAGMGECHLRRADVRGEVEKCLLHFDDARYDMDAFVVMPNHVHALLMPREGFALFDLLKGMKGVSARNCNRRLGRTGEEFWMEDAYNRIVRDAEELWAFREYIERNPVKAKLRTNEYTLAMRDVLAV